MVQISEKCVAHADVAKQIEQVQMLAQKYIALELEMKYMKEKIDLLIKQNEQIKERLDKLTSWYYYVLGIWFSISSLYIILTQNWHILERIFK